MDAPITLKSSHGSAFGDEGAVIVDLKEVFEPSAWESTFSPTYKSFMISLATFDHNADFLVHEKELQDEKAQKLMHLFRKRAIILICNMMLVGALTFIVCINVFMSPVVVSEVPFLGSSETSAGTLPYGTAGWVSKKLAGTLLLTRTLSAAVAIIAAFSSILFGVAYTAALTTWLHTPADVIAWNRRYKLMTPVFMLVVATALLMLALECHAFLAYPAVIGAICSVVFTCSVVSVNVYIFRFYSKYFEDKLDKKAAAIWTEMKEHLGDRLGGQQRAGSSLDEVL